MRLADRLMLGGEAQQMADLKHPAGLGRERGERVGLGERRRNRLLDQHVPARAQRRFGEREMRLGRGGDDDRVAFREQRRPVAQAAAPVSRASAEARAALGSSIGGEPGARRGRDLQRVKAPEMPCPGQPDPQHHPVPRCPASW